MFDRYCAHDQMRSLCKKIETSSFREATRCRRAQYSGRATGLNLNGSRFFGLVRSVQEDQSRSPRRWIVTIVPTVEKPPLVGWLARAPRSQIQRKFADQLAVSERHDEVGASALLPECRRGLDIQQECCRVNYDDFGTIAAASIALNLRGKFADCGK